MISLEGLPVEVFCGLIYTIITKLKMFFDMQILYEIQLYSLSESLPLVCRRFYTIVKSASPFFHAQYILGRIVREKKNSLSEIYSRALRYPICDQQVVQSIRHLVKELNFTPQEKESLVRLPARIFRNLRSGSSLTAPDEPLPLLRYLWDCPDIPKLDLNYPNGYPLTKAVHTKFVPLITFLLDRHASPKCHDRLAVKVAIRKKDLGLLKLLVERSSSDLDNRGKQSRNKRRKLSDRVPLDVELLTLAIGVGARDIVHYLHEEKGVVPNMETIKKMVARGKSRQESTVT